MYLRLGNKILNTDNIVEARVFPATPAGVDEYTGEEYRATSLSVEIVTTAITSEYDDGGDLPEFRHTRIFPHTISLHREDAEKFLVALPVYEPVMEPGEE